MQQNCWEFKKCGREHGGPKTAELGVCPASTEKRTNGIHGGKNGGRSCWAVAGTFCGGRVQGAFAAKLASCLSCEFYKQVAKEQGPSLVRDRQILSMLT